MYEYYVSDALFYLANLNVRYSELVGGDKNTENRSSDEIIADIRSKIEKMRED